MARGFALSSSSPKSETVSCGSPGGVPLVYAAPRDPHEAPRGPEYPALRAGRLPDGHRVDGGRGRLHRTGRAAEAPGALPGARAAGARVGTDPRHGPASHSLDRPPPRFTEELAPQIHPAVGLPVACLRGWRVREERTQ